MNKRENTAKVHDRLSSDLPYNASVAIAIVADPYSQIGEKIQVIRSVRDDPLAGMHARRQIDDAQLAAGRKWQMLHECATVGVIRAIDPTKEAVDGGRIPEFLTDPQIKAFRALTEAYKHLDATVNRVIFSVLSERKSIATTATDLGYITDRGARQIGFMFRDGLESLAKLWGFAGGT